MHFSRSFLCFKLPRYRDGFVRSPCPSPQQNIIPMRRDEYPANPLRGGTARTQTTQCDTKETSIQHHTNISNHFRFTTSILLKVTYWERYKIQLLKLRLLSYVNRRFTLGLSRRKSMLSLREMLTF